MDELEVGDVVAFKGMTQRMTVTKKIYHWFSKTTYNFAFFDREDSLNITTNNYSKAVRKV